MHNIRGMDGGQVNNCQPVQKMPKGQMEMPYGHREVAVGSFTWNKNGCGQGRSQAYAGYASEYSCTYVLYVWNKIYLIFTAASVHLHEATDCTVCRCGI